MKQLINILDARTGDNPGIHFGIAISKDNTNDFVRSGSKRILDYLIQQLGEIPMLIDFSSRPSSFQNEGNLADFMTIYDPANSFFIRELDDAYYNVYDTLGIKGYDLGLFYRKDFFHKPKSPLYYYNDEVREEFKDKIAKEWLPKGDRKIVDLGKEFIEEWIIPSEQKNVRFKNESIQLSYSEYERSIENRTNEEFSCADLNEVLLGFYDRYFKNSSFMNSGCLLSVPLIGYPSRAESTDDVFEGLGAIFVYFCMESKPNAIKIREIANGLWFLGLQITYNSMFQIAYELADSAKRESIKSTIASIMSRNMSHNLGSHFLTNTKNYFKQRVDEVEKDTVNKELLGADYRGNVILLQYLQERMDFISTVVSGEHYPFGSLNVESQLYDVLTSDEQGSRQGKPTKNFLLDYIVYSEKLTRLYQKDDPQQQFHNLVIQLSFNDGKREIVFKGRREDKEGKHMLSKTRLAAPGGLMARHAFFSIIENILRNSAKHHRNDKDLTLSIKLEKVNDGQMEVSIFDTDNPAANKVTSIFRELIILNVDNSINKYNKGLKEILICVLWLQNKDVSDWLYDNVQKKGGYDVSKKDAVLRVSDKDGGLCYTFDVPIIESKHELKEGKEYKRIYDNNKNGIEFLNGNLRQIHADFIIAEKNFEVIEKDVKYGKYRCLNNIFPRFLTNSELDGAGDLRLFAKDHFKEYFEEKNTLEQQMRGGDFELLWLLWNHHHEYFDEIICINGTFSNGRKTENDNKEEKTTIEQNGKVVVKKLQEGDEDWRILFYDHFHSKTLQEKISILKKSEGKLMESISGENYTSTIVTYDFLNDPELRYKTVEALETKIVIIDERIFGDMRKRQLDMVKESVEVETTPKWWQDCQNENDLESKLKKNNSSNYTKNKVRIQKTLQSKNDFSSKKEILQKLLYAPKEESTEYSKLSKKDKECAEHIEQMVLERKNVYLSDFQKDFADYKFKNLSGGEQNEIKGVDFLTIHLGIIEKFVTWYCTTHNIRKEDRKMALNECFRRIEAKYHPKFISIHSGRGNFSPELQKDLKSYPFISLSALEAAFYNCKYFLSELFYNMNYYGKGNLNH